MTMLFLIIFSHLLWLQQNFVRDSDPPAKWKVNIDTSSGKEVRLPSPAMRLLPQCRGGMCYAVFAMDPARGVQQEIAAFTLSGQSHFLDPSLIQGLTNISIRDFTPTEDGGVYVLIHATDKDSRSESRGTPGNNYLAVYDSNGQFKEIHHLELQFDPERMVSLPEKTLVSGFDKANNLPVLAILGPDGRLVSSLDDQGTLPNAATLLANSTLKTDKNTPILMQQIAIGGALSRLTFGYAGSRALLLNPGANAAIWEIRGTEVKKTNLMMPIGVVAASIVPSDGAWLVRAFVSATDTGMLLEFDRETGNLKRTVDSGDVPATSIFLESDNTFYALWWNAKHQSFVVKSN